MTEKRCGTCKHWGNTKDAGGRFRDCQRIQHDSAAESLYEERQRIVLDDESVFDEPAVTMDGSNYWAVLRTKPDFSCSLWEEK